MISEFPKVCSNFATFFSRAARLDSVLETSFSRIFSIVCSRSAAPEDEDDDYDYKYENGDEDDEDEQGYVKTVLNNNKKYMHLSMSDSDWE